MSQQPLAHKPKPAIQKPNTTAIKQIIIRGAFWRLWGTLRVLLGVPGAPLGCFWGPWSTLGDLWGSLWVPKGRPSHMSQKRSRLKKKTPPFGALLAPKLFPSRQVRNIALHYELEACPLRPGAMWRSVALYSQVWKLFLM